MACGKPSKFTRSELQQGKALLTKLKACGALAPKQIDCHLPEELDIYLEAASVDGVIKFPPESELVLYNRSVRKLFVTNDMDELVQSVWPLGCGAFDAARPRVCSLNRPLLGKMSVTQDACLLVSTG